MFILFVCNLVFLCLHTTELFPFLYSDSTLRRAGGSTGGYYRNKEFYVSSEVAKGSVKVT